MSYSLPNRAPRPPVSAFASPAAQLQMEEAGNQRPKKVELLPYDSLYPSGEAQKAVKLVQDEISGHRKELDRLHEFAADNTGLINLVRRLPDELSHDIMVPFGKAAFFPGRLIHTNEFLVLLGEGYYADQTAKQTIGVLKRRGQVLQSQMEALNSTIEDLEARARFFGETAGASGEGMVEIREYEESQEEEKNDLGSQDTLTSTLSDNVKISITDEEYAQILAKLEDHEKAELAAESVSSEDEAEPSSLKFHHPSNDLDRKTSLEQHMKGSKESSKDEPRHTMGPLSNKNLLQEVFSDSLSLDGSKSRQKQETYQTQVGGKSFDGSTSDPKDASVVKPSYSLDRSQKPDVAKEINQGNTPKDPASESLTHDFSQRKAFNVTSSIVEHSDGKVSSMGTSTSNCISKDTTSKPSKPVSRFKMQRGR